MVIESYRQIEFFKSCVWCEECEHSPSIFVIGYVKYIQFGYSNEQNSDMFVFILHWKFYYG